MDCSDSFTHIGDKKAVDAEGTQGNWEIKKVEGMTNVFNIIISEKRHGGRDDCQRKYLSVAGDCSQTYVDVWGEDDNSGNQRFYAERVEGMSSNYFSLKNIGRTQCDKVFLSNFGNGRLELSDVADAQSAFHIIGGNCKAK